MRVIALIPARVGSKGVPEKNWRPLNSKNCVDRAAECALQAGITELVISTDKTDNHSVGAPDIPPNVKPLVRWLYAPAPLHTDDCAMIDVVTDALARVPGEPDDIWVLLQPSSPLRTPATVVSAIRMMQGLTTESVASVSPTTPVDSVLMINLHGYLQHAHPEFPDYVTNATRRQDHEPEYRRDGGVYAFRRNTVARYGSIYGEKCAPIFRPQSESLSIDTLDDWREAERRLKEQETETPTPAFSGRGMLNLRG